GISPAGAAMLLREDPYTQGPRLFASKCASCHTYDGHDGLGRPQNEPSAPDLKGFGTREWLFGLLDPAQIETPKFFHGTKFVEPDEKGKKSRMVEFVHDLSNLTAKGREELEKVVAVVSAEAELNSQARLDALLDEDDLREGIDLFFSGFDGGSAACGDCHGFDGEDSEAARTPTLTDWASRQWMIEFTKNPEHPKFYGSGNDRMPIFEEEGIFTDQEIGMVVDWLREEWIRYEGSAVKAEASAQ
ncbi:MAG: hypothetical protein KDM63_20335, partial [Verrucomicrobiae bacterium]|nr:hypothetical protein [Verrucomicrobiae bacterium]